MAAPADNTASFLERRALKMIANARQELEAGDPGPVSEQLKATCQFLFETYGISLPDLPELYQALSHVLDRMGARSEAETFQTLAWEVQKARDDRSRELWDTSRLSTLLSQPALAGNWPREVRELSRQMEICLEPPHAAPLALMCSCHVNLAAGVMRELGRKAIDRLWPTLVLEAKAMSPRHASTKRTPGLRPQDFDAYPMLLVHGLDLSSVSCAEDTAMLRELLDHRRTSKLTLLSLWQSSSDPPPAELPGVSAIQHLLGDAIHAVPLAPAS